MPVGVDILVEILMHACQNMFWPKLKMVDGDKLHVECDCKLELALPEEACVVNARLVLLL